MAPTRSRRARARTKPSCVPDDVSATATRFSEQLQKELNPAQPLIDSLHPFLNPAAPKELPLNAFLLETEALLRTQTSPTTRLRLSHLLHSLTYHNPTPDLFPQLCALMQLATTTSHSRDSATLATCLRAITQTASHIRDSHRETLDRLIPSIIPPLHTALFCRRQTYDPVHNSSATDDSSVQKHFSSVRPVALEALIALSAVASRAIVAYWQLLLPTRPGVPNTQTTRDNLATLILFDSQQHVRSAAVTAVTALISSSRAFIRRIRATAHTPTTAFTSVSTRVVTACNALHYVVATAIAKETDGVIVAKLARLAAELLTVLPVPAVKLEAFGPLFTALWNRCLDIGNTDLTARSAAASALCVGLQKSGASLDHSLLKKLAEDIIAVLRAECAPAAEMLAILKCVTYLQPDIFHLVWDCLQQFLENAFLHEKAESLHAVRLAESFMNAVLNLQRDGDVNREEMKRHVRLACCAYHALLKPATRSRDRAVILSGLAATDYLQVILSEELQYCEGCNASHDVLKEIRIQLQHTLLSDATDAVRAAAARVLGNFPVGYGNETDVHSLFHCLLVTIREVETSDVVRGKILGAMSLQIDRVLEDVSFPTDYIFPLVVSGASHAIQSAAKSDERHASLQSTGADRSKPEIMRLAALNLCASCISFFTAKDRLHDENSLNVEELEASLGVELCAVVRDESELLKVRSHACNAIARVTAFAYRQCSNRIGSAVEQMIASLIYLLSSAAPPRLHITAAKALSQWARVSSEIHPRISVLRSGASCYQSTSKRLQMPGISTKDKDELRFLKSTLSDMVLYIFSKADNSFAHELTKEEVSHADAAVLVEYVANSVFKTELETKSVADSSVTTFLPDTIGYRSGGSDFDQAEFQNALSFATKFLNSTVSKS